MPGGFINTKYNQTVDSLVDGLKNRLNNPYYIHTDLPPVITNWFNQSLTASTVDEAAKIPYSAIGDESPTKYNYIKDAIWYGHLKFPINLDLNENGPDSGEINGTGMVAPNTWEPLPNDFFTITHTGKTLLYKVTAVRINTLESDANAFEFDYTLDKIDNSFFEKISKQIVKRYTMVVNNVGTQLKSIVLQEDYDYIDRIEATIAMLRKYYKTLFYKKSVQTFVFEFETNFFYDPYLIEFLIRNRIMDDSNDYLYIDHATKISETFPIEYDQTFFRAFETRDKKRVKAATANGFEITDMNSLLTTRVEPYFILDYRVWGYALPIEVFPAEIVNSIINDNMYGDYDKTHALYNIFIDYFNERDVKAKYVEMLDTFEYSTTKEVFYMLPLIIFILQNKVIELLK